MSHIRVATYNIRKCVGLDRKRSPERTLDVIAGLEADMVVLQEADRRFGGRPATLTSDAIRTRSGLAAASVSASHRSLGWHGNAVLHRDDIEILAIDRITLPALEPRGAVLVEARRHGQTLRVVATHLGLTRSYRRRQLRRIAEAVAERDTMPTIILGDFNEWKTRAGLEPLAAEYRVHAPGRSFHAARPVAALDRIATNDRITLEDGGVVETGPATMASDHLPVWADLSLRPASPPAT